MTDSDAIRNDRGNRFMRCVAAMMRCALCVLIIWNVCAAVAWCAAEQGALVVVIENVNSEQGFINIALCSAAEQYYEDTEYFQAVRIAPQAPETEYVFEAIPHGNYALKVYHDQNSNNKLDTGFLGKPREPYGFSNNPRVVRAMPAFKTTLFSVRDARQVQHITLK